MRKHAYNNNKITIVEAEKGKYLALDTENSEELIGRPTRIIFDNSAEVPELIEKEVN